MYLNTKHKKKVGNLLEEIQIKFAFHYKGRAVVQGILAKMWCEHLAVTETSPLPPFEALVDPELIQGAIEARDKLRIAIADSGANTSDTIQRIVKLRSPDLYLADPQIGVELALVDSLSGAGSEDGMQKSMLQCLPSAGNKKSIAVCLSQLKVLNSGQQKKMCTHIGQQRLKFTIEAVESIASGVDPEIGADMLKCEVMSNIVAQFSWWCKHPKDSPAAAAPASAAAAVVPYYQKWW